MRPNHGHNFSCLDAKGNEQNQTTMELCFDFIEKKRREKQIKFLKEKLNMSDEDIQMME